ncbi:MAG: S9 family peptidase, partial [Ferruginibacter sp.]
MFKIKPLFQETRQAKIKKKGPDEMPKDSLGIIEMGLDSVLKIAKVKSFKTPEKAGGWMAYLLEKADAVSPKAKALPDSATQINSMLQMADSLMKMADSLRNKTKEVQIKGLAVLAPAKKEAKPTIPKADAEKVEEGTELVLRNMMNGIDKKIKLVTEYYFSKKANTLIVETSAKNNDSITKATVLWVDLSSGKTDTVLKKFNDAKNYAINEEGDQLAFVAERDSATKALTKFYKLYHFRKGGDSAVVIAEKNTVGMKLGNTVSENANLLFSKDGSKLFFGTAPIKAPKDTTLVDFELARLDVWHYNDDYLQPQQLKQLDQELKRSYLAVIKPGDNKMVQLGADDAERITLVNEGNADWVLAETNKGNRVEGQWTGRTKTAAYIISTFDGIKKLVLANSYANFDASPSGKYVYWYDVINKNYFIYDIATGITQNATSKIKVPLYDEENDVPDYPSPHGVMGWSKDDNNLYLYDKYEVWEVNPKAALAPHLLFQQQQQPRKNKVTYRYISTNREERFVNIDSPMIFRVFDNKTKMSSLEKAYAKNGGLFFNNALQQYTFGFPVKAKNAVSFIYTKENYTSSPNLYFTNQTAETLLSDINPQQNEFNWGTAELFKWKSYTGKESEGIIYKPQNFDPKKKYPMISYFYEKLSDGLYSYIPPSPTASRLNI